jgi:hypothetical protein
MGPTGFFPPADRAVLAGRAFNIAGEWASVPSGGERFLGLVMDAGKMGVVWAISVGLRSDGTGNKPLTVTQYIGIPDVDPSAALVGNMLSGGPAFSGATALVDDSIGTLVKAYSFPHNSGIGNILNGIRILRGGSSGITIGIRNDDSQPAGILTASALVAIFDIAEVETTVI